MDNLEKKFYKHLSKTYNEILPNPFDRDRIAKDFAEIVEKDCTAKILKMGQEAEMLRQKLLKDDIIIAEGKVKDKGTYIAVGDKHLGHEIGRYHGKNIKLKIEVLKG